MARFVTPQTIAELMGMEQAVAESDGTPLCPTHYRQLHRTLRSHDYMYKKRKCIVCNCTVQKKDVCHCPDPQTIEEYYSSNTEFSISIREDSVVCSMCYHAQLAIVKRHRLTSHDSNLQTVLIACTVMNLQLERTQSTSSYWLHQKQHHCRQWAPGTKAYASCRHL